MVISGCAERNITLAEACKRAGISLDRAERIMEVGVDRILETQHDLHKLLSVIRLDLAAIVSGRIEAPDSAWTRRQKHLFETVRKLVFEWVFKAEEPRTAALGLLEYYRRKIEEMGPNTIQSAASPGLPINVKMVARDYERLYRTGK